MPENEVTCLGKGSQHIRRISTGSPLICSSHVSFTACQVLKKIEGVLLGGDVFFEKLFYKKVILASKILINIYKN